MADIAQLGIAVDTSQTTVAVRELNKLADAGGKAEASAKQLGSTSQRAMSEIAASTARAAAAAEKMLASQERQERMMQQVAMQIGSLTGAMGANAAAQNAMAKAAQDAAQALSSQSKAANESASALSGAAKAAQQNAVALSEQGNAARASTESHQALAGSVKTFIGALTVDRVYEFGKAVFEASASAERLRTTLDFASGGQGASELAYVTKTANTLGLELQTTAKAYAQLAASARGTSLEGAGARAIFESVSKASAVMGLTAEQTGGALNALQQMISKGSVQSEELRGQLGERLPGAFQIAARAMGVTTAELGKMLEQGLVPASDFLPKFAAQLELEVGGAAEKAADRLDASTNKMINSWTALKTAIGDSGISRSIANEMSAISQDLTVASEAMANVKSEGGSAFTQLAVGAAELAGRAGFGLLNTASNTLNGTINLLTGGIFALRTDLAYVPDVMKTNAQQAAIMGGEMEAAKTKLARLQELDRNPANGNYFKTAIANTQAYIGTLDAAIRKKQQLERGGAGADVYSPSGVARAVQERVDAVERERKAELDAYTQKDARQTKQMQKEEAIAKARAANAKMVEKFAGDEAALAKINLALKSEIANLEEKYKPKKSGGGSGMAVGESELAGIMARVKATQASIKAMQEYGAATEKQTEADKLVFKLQEELAGGIKGVARANKEKALAAAQSLAVAQREENALKSQIESQKKHEAEYRKSIESMSDAADKTEQQAIALEAQNAQYGKSRTAIEELVLAQQKLKLSRLEELGLTGDYTEALKSQIAAQERLVDAMKAADYKRMDEHTSKLLASSQEQAELYQDELQLTGMSALERAKIVAQRQVELKYAKEIEAINQSNLTDEQKTEQRLRVNTAKEIESSAAANKVVQDDWAKTSEQISQSLTDALMRGFEGGKDAAKNMRDTIVNMFKTMVLKPTIQAIIQPVVGGITGMLGMSGATQAAQAGSGLLGGVGNLASLAGSLGSFGTALGAGASMAASGLAGFTTALEGGVAMLGSATGFSSAMAGIGQLAGALGPVALGVTALASIFSQRATPHTGGVAQYSAAGGLQASNQGGMFNTGFSAVHYGEEAIKTVASLAKAVVTELDKTALSFGRKAGYEMAAAFADDASKDPAWGALRISQGGRDIVNWSEDTSKWLQREFADGEKGLEQFMQAVAKDVVTVLKDMDLPGWAGRFTKAMPDDASMEQVNTLLATLREYPNKLLEIAGTSRDALVSQFTEGLMTGNATQAAKAGQSVADTLVSSIEQSMMGAAAGQIFDIVNRGIVTPMIDALLTGQSVTEALSDAAIADVVAKATATAQALGAIMGSSEFQTALSTIKTSVGAALGSAGGAFGYKPRYQAPTTATPVQDAAAKAAEDLAKKIQDAIDGVKADNLQLQIDLLRENGDEAGAALMELNRATAGWGADKREEYRLLLQESAALKENLRIAQSMNKLREEHADLEISLMRAQGDEAGALARETAIATKNMSDQERAAYAANRTLEQQISTQQSLNALNEDATLLAIDLLRAQGKEEAALTLERDAAVKGISDLEIAQYDANQATRKLIQGIQSLQGAFDEAWNALATPEQQRQRSYAGALNELSRNGVNVTMEQAIGASSADILQFIGHVSQLGEVSAETRANIIQAATSIAELNQNIGDQFIAGAQELLSKLNADTIKHINDEAETKIKAWEKERTIAQERQGIEQTALQLTRNTIEVRRRELNALDATNQALQQRVWAVQDAESGMDKALALVQRSVNAEKQRISESAQAQIDAINAEQEARKKAIDTAQEAISDLQGLFDSITDTVKTLRGNVLTEQQNMERARAYIAMSLSVARAGGDVNAERLQEAMQTVSGDTAQTYTTGAEYRYQQARQAAVLDELGGIVGGRLSGAKTQLEALNTANTLAQDQIKAITEARDAQIKTLDAQLKAAEDAVSVAKGVDISVIGVDDSITGLHGAIAVYENARDTLDRESLSVGYEANRLLTSQIDNANLLREQELKDWELRHTEAANQLTALGKIDTSILSLQSAMNGIASGLQAQAAAQAAAAAAAQAIATASTTSYQQVDMVSSGGPMPSFDVGTNYVPRDMTAQIHKGEAIVPEKFNPAIFSQGSSSNADLVRLVANLTDEIKRLQNLAREGNSEQRRTADAVNGRPEAPMLVEVA